MYKNMLEMLRESAKKFDDKPLFCFKQDGEYKSISYNLFYEKVRNLASGFIETGIKKDDKVFVFCDNRYEWMMMDFALQWVGAIMVPRGTDTSYPEVEFIIGHSQADYLVVENAKAEEKLKDLKATVKRIGIGNDVTKADFYFEKIIETGKNFLSKNKVMMDSLFNEANSDTIVSIIYTSGTTGNPKGVMLSHGNFIHDIINSLQRLMVYSEDEMISVLPIWHIFERMVEYTMINKGATVYYSSIKAFVNDVKTVKPTMIIVVPRILEAFYDKVKNNISKMNLLKKSIFNFFYNTNSIYFDLICSFKKNIPSYKKANTALSILSFFCLPFFIIFHLISKVLFKSIHDVLGGRTRVIISGGGSLPYQIDKFFNVIGFDLLDGYGMTETSPIICLRDAKRLVLGTSGRVIDNTESKIVKPDGNEALQGEKGELLVKGGLVMKGYFNNKEATDKAIIDGWFHTGDLAAKTFYGDIKILGRIKDTIVLIGGENVEPEKIETYLKQSSLINNAVVLGQNQKRLKALVIPEKEKVMEFASEKKLEYGDYDNLINSKEVYDEIKREIDDNVNSNPEFKTFEKIFDFKIIPKPFEIGDELTQSLKLKRHVIYEKYRSIIDSMFGKV